jgi:hypothetical protein
VDRTLPAKKRDVSRAHTRNEEEFWLDKELTGTARAEHNGHAKQELCIVCLDCLRLISAR